ncbi:MULTISPECIES: DUF1285 domain-containing protein [Shewanella]|uniref:DUF1285 domain-containing protein n=1 Tax=Shewanella TaxID=22 RepID=UPI001EFE57CA|nr:MULTISPECIES: DUF1285 domain-containing protein [Shewanella]MCG9746071.1 DUF1285 domain-containing protein [Shewanella sp. Isolate8]MCL2910173.1 DUF1285 domain-containing protein [Shewanella aquimarina]
MADNQPDSALQQFTQGVPLCDEEALFHIDSQGRWFYRGEPLPDKFCRLFATILHLKSEGYFLMTPVETVRVEVAEFPFIINDYEETQDGHFTLTSSIGTQFQLAGRDAFVVDEAAISVSLGRGLSAKLGRACYYRFIEQYMLNPEGDVK